MKYLNTLILMSAVILLSACGGSSSNDDKNDSTNDNTNNNNNEEVFACTTSEGPVNWEKVLKGDAEKLSEYQLFSNTCDPTQSHSDRSLPYDLSAALFTDYASKYRFIFIPEGKTVTYNEKEAFDFPLGTVITKTFAMPADTSERGLENEKLIETRLLINQESGWIARTYIWNDAGTEAFLGKVGANVGVESLKHGNQDLSFTYKVPTQSQCLTCHQLKTYDNDGAELGVVFKPLGPKARFLNSDYDYGQGPKNQLTKWFEEGLLIGLPDISTVQKAAPFSDDMVPNDYNGSQQLLTDTAKSWLDINCGHCHRKEGQASNTAFRADFNIKWEGNERFHGACEDPVSGHQPDSTKIIVPGNADVSLLYNRMHTTQKGQIMPSLGRAIIHEEGSALIKEWINSLNPDLCN